MKNMALKDEMRQLKQKVFQLESDLDVLKSTLEDNIPYFNQLENENQDLHKQIQHQHKKNEIKENDRSFLKIRSLEQQLKKVKDDADKLNKKLKVENQ